MYSCLIVDDEPIARDIILGYLDKIPRFDRVYQCQSAQEALTILEDIEIDLVFLDINMPEISGVTLAKVIQHKTCVIFTTAYRDYAIEGFEVEAIDYLLKPIPFDRFFKAIEKFFKLGKKHLELESEQEAFFVRSERKMIRILKSNILYVESLGDYVQFYLKEGKVVTRESMTSILEQLNPGHFLRVHRSYVVAKSAVQSYTHEFVEIGNKAIPIGRTYKEEVIKSFQ